MEAFLWSIEFGLGFFADVLGYMTTHRIYGLFILMSLLSLFISALTGSKSRDYQSRLRKK